MELIVKLVIDEGWHINAHIPEEEELIPTVISIGTNSGAMTIGTPGGMKNDRKCSLCLAMAMMVTLAYCFLVLDHQYHVLQSIEIIHEHSILPLAQ